MTVTAPQLFGLAVGLPERGDSCRCFFCVGKCGPETPASDFVKSSFTSLDTVGLSPYVCQGCIASQSERSTIRLLDGTIRESQRVRCYSWVITATSAIAATKSHRAQLLSLCLNPPEPPFVICLADSGQKHLLYRAPVCRDRSRIVVSLEGVPVWYYAPELADRVQLCKAMAAVVGKPALSEPLPASLAMRVVDRYDSDEFLDRWLKLRQDPLTALAIWLCPPKEECEREFPGNVCSRE